MATDTVSSASYKPDLTSYIPEPPFQTAILLPRRSSSLPGKSTTSSVIGHPPGPDSLLLNIPQVEGRIYKIHRHFLERESEFFRDLFPLPQGDSKADAVEGKDDDHPIKLVGTTTAEFDSLLRFFYFEMHSDYKPSLDEWMTTLSISTRFIFDKVRERAIAEITARLNSFDPFELIAGANKYDVDQWLTPAYRRIVLRSAIIAEREALSIPFSTSMMLMRARERFWKQYYHHQ
ncbi:hypothetical protein BC834DRAFT_842676 [Gloeopeniophorella convolvens]|nr:hypothetical protein BC834DRAFT_842676 [Gloeopeniophorella convolvens]